MNKNTVRVIVVLAVVFLLFTVTAFAIPFVKNGLFFFAYFFGVLAIAAQLYILKLAFVGDAPKSKVYGVPIAMVGVIYLAAQLVLSLVFMALSSIAPFWLAVLLFFLLAGCTVLGLTAADVQKEHAETVERKTEKDTAAMTALQSVAAGIAAACPDAEAKKALTKLAEEFRYSDPVSCEATKNLETELANKLAELKTILSTCDSAKLSVKCGELTALLAERNRICKGNK